MTGQDLLAQTHTVENRKQFLLQMYNQLWSNINRHILIPWQSITAVLGTFAIFSLVEKQIISLDLASSLIILIAAWQIAHVYDASTWVNRNLAIIVNIEKQFLISEDIKNIHWFFQGHRSWDHLDNFKIQMLLGAGIIVIILSNHFLEVVVPGFGKPISFFNFISALPYAVFVSSIIGLILFRKKMKKDYKDFSTKSPGIDLYADITVDPSSK